MNVVLLTANVGSLFEQIDELFQGWVDAVVEVRRWKKKKGEGEEEGGNLERSHLFAPRLPSPSSSLPLPLFPQ